MIPDKKFAVFRKKIEQGCLDCNGAGCLSCKKKIARIQRYGSAGIPVDYWERAFKDFSGDPNFKDIISKKISNIDNMYDEGVSIALIGNLGTGKTYAASCLLKKAIVSGYQAKYANMSDVVRKLTSPDSNNYFDEIVSVDFLCIDEYCKRHVFASEKAEQLFGQSMEAILRNRFQNKMPTIICSNTLDLEDVLADDFSDSTSSLIKYYVEIHLARGLDFRSKK